MDAKQTGALVARRRRARGLSQAELAEELHISDKTVSKWETGRGMPGIDLLEALGEALQLSVSELVRGTELTPEELPKAAGEELVTSMKRGGKMLWRGAIAALLAVMLLLAGNAGCHYVFSVDGDDKDSLSRAADNYLSRWDETPQADPSLRVVSTEKRGDYLAALCTNSEGEWRMCVYDRDTLFPDRYRASGGKRNFNSGELKSWNFGNSREAVIIFCGGSLPERARWYTFTNSGIRYVCSIENGTVLDVFLLPDTNDISASSKALLDENQQPLE